MRAFCGHVNWPEGDAELQLLLKAFGSLRKVGNEGAPFFEMCLSLLGCRAAEGQLACREPVR